VGVVCWALALLGAVTMVLLHKRVAFHVFFLAAGGMFTGIAVFVLPGETWLLGCITLCFAVGGSVVLRLYELVPEEALIRFRRRREETRKDARRMQRFIAQIVSVALHPKAWRRSLLPLALAVVLAVSLPVWLSPMQEASFGDNAPQAQIRYEQQGYGIAVLPLGSPVPSTIPDSLPPSRLLLAGYQSNLINKISSDQINVDTQASLLDHQTHGDRFQMLLRHPATLDILTAYFPGWQASLDNTPIAVSDNPQTGLMRVTLPVTEAGEFTLSLGPTPTRVAAWVVTWSSLLILLVLTLLRFRRQTPLYDELDLLKVAEARLVGFVSVCFVLLVVLTAIPGAMLPIRARPGYALDNSFAVQSRTQVGLEALAYRLEKTNYQPGDTLRFVLYWQTLRFLPQNYRVQVYLRDETQGLSWFRSDLRSPGGYPTRRWLSNHYVSDPYTLALSPTLTPGNYRIAVELYDCPTTCSAENRLTFFDSVGRDLGPVLILPTVIAVTGAP
jgi:hypothetical protein